MYYLPVMDPFAWWVTVAPFDKWLYVMLVGLPAATLVIYHLTRSTDEAVREDRALGRFSRRFGLAVVRSLPGELARAIAEVTDGDLQRHFVFHKGVAYLSVARSNAVEASDSLHFVMKLEEPGPTMTVRPVPVVDGKKERPKGAIVFQKDPEFTEEFVVEGPQPKAIGRFLAQHLRDLLLDLPQSFLRVQGKTLVFSVFGRLDADEIERVAVAADELFVEYGAKGGRPLLPEPDDDADLDEPPPEPKKKARPKAKLARA